MLICPICHKHLPCIEDLHPGEVFTCDVCQQVWVKIDGKVINSEQYYKLIKPKPGGKK